MHDRMLVNQTWSACTLDPSVLINLLWAKYLWKKEKIELRNFALTAGNLFWMFSCKMFGFASAAESENQDETERYFRRCPNKVPGSVDKSRLLLEWIPPANLSSGTSDPLRAKTTTMSRSYIPTYQPVRWLRRRRHRWRRRKPPAGRTTFNGNDATAQAFSRRKASLLCPETPKTKK